MTTSIVGPDWAPASSAGATSAPSPRAEPKPLEPFLVNRLEAARLLSVSPGTVDNLVADGRLEKVKLRHTTRYRVTDLERLAATGCAAGRLDRARHGGRERLPVLDVPPRSSRPGG